jgi:hypothetical protein
MKINKKITTVLAMALCVASIAGCSSSKEINVTELASALLANGTYAEELSEVSSQITEKRYALTEDDVEEAVGYAGTNAVVDEIAIFKAKDVDAVSEKVSEHIDSQIKTYESYRPDEVSKLDDCIVTVSGDYVIVCVSEDSTGAKKIIDEYVK